MKVALPTGRKGSVRFTMVALLMFTWHLGWDAAFAEPIHWTDKVATCYDSGVHDHKPIVILFYDRVTSGVSADKVSIRLSLSPRIQAVAPQAVWCFADVSTDLVSRNIAKALRITQYPSLSVLAPKGDMLDEAARIYDLGFFETGSRADMGFEEEAERRIILQIEKLATEYR